MQKKQDSVEIEMYVGGSPLLLSSGNMHESVMSHRPSSSFSQSGI